MNNSFSPEISKEHDVSSQERAEYLKRLPKAAHIHISGVCGTGTGAVLSLLKQSGFYVTGSDKAFYPPMGTVVKELADKIFEGYSADNFRKRPDLVVIGNALSRGNPEIEFVIEQGIPFCSMPEVFSGLLIGSREECKTSVVVSGTHGKTTTTSLIASILMYAGKSPGYFIGGVPTGDILEGSLRLCSKELPPSERIVVLEGDEYDSAFFAKYSKFHCYRPDIAVVTNLEFDHGDIFEDIDAIKREFSSFLKKVPDDGMIFVCKDAKPAFELVKELVSSNENSPKMFSYGTDSSSDIYLSSRSAWAFEESSEESSEGRVGQRLEFVIDARKIEVMTPLTGLHNALNIAAAIGVCSQLGISHDTISQGLKAFSPVKRRQQVITNSGGIVLIEDFAHHPTEVKVTLEGLRDAYPDRRVVVLFEPRSNTSRRAFFRDEYKDALSVADVILVKEVETSTSGTPYAGVGSSKPLFEVSELINLLKASNKKAYSDPHIPGLFSQLRAISKAGDLIVVMSNGDFGGIIGMIKEMVEK